MSTDAPTGYLRDPAAIYRRSFEIVRRECDLGALPDAVGRIALRLVHACGMPDIIDDLRWSGDVHGAAHRALRAGAPVIADCRMAANGVIARRLPAGNDIMCTIDDPRTETLARRRATTRSAAAVDLWGDRLDGAVVTIGNAPTALFRLLEILADGAPRPAAIFAFPVGFVGAAESQPALVEADLDAPFITLTGRRGGRPLAAAAVHAASGARERDR